ncbi:MAG: PhnD/SsuA/transferrin family substrate-binding protein [Chloroflexi bacterium]|nr:PhnD/SsuA/transferrin family substrate-binding protein [Chloroflexota bacterium]
MKNLAVSGHFLSRLTYRLLSLCLLLLLALTACQGDGETVEVTVPVTVEVTRVVTAAANNPVVTEITPTAAAPTNPTPAPSLIPGSADYPVLLVFPPTVPVPVIEARQEPFLEALTNATGLSFETIMPGSFREMLDLLCNEPERTIAFLPPEVYVLAHEQCGAQVGQAFVRLGHTWNSGMIVIRNETSITSLEELDGQTWGIPGSQSRTGAIFFDAMFQRMGLTPGEITEYPGESRALAALYDGEVTFATATFVPPIMPYNETQWQYGVDDPEPWQNTLAVPVRSGIGYVIVNGDVNQGGYRLREARSALLDTVPGIFVETQILALTPPIPFEAVAYGVDFPFGIANEVAVAMMAFANQAVCVESVCSADFLNMTGLEPVANSFYDTYREMMATLAWDEAEILGE